MGTIFERLTAILADILDDDSVSLCATTVADTVDGWDSLANFRFMLAVETAFDVRFSAEDMASFQNVGDLAQCIAAKSG